MADLDDAADVDAAPGTNRSAIDALIAAGILVSVVLGVSVGLLILLARQGKDRGPEAALSLVFVATVVVLILVMCTLSIVFRRLEVYDPGQAMGLPRGSVRAVIALLLIMLFFISAIFLFNSTKNGDSAESRTLTGISEDRFNELATEDIQSAVQRQDGDQTVYDVTRTANTNTSNDIAKQLVTTVATLVTAVAAFYFGANSVTTAFNVASNPNPSPTPIGTGGGDDQGGGSDNQDAEGDESSSNRGRGP